MLALDDPAWGSLTQAYGSGAAIPPLLVDLKASIERPEVADNVVGKLIAALCHQTVSVYTASYAAVPHIVRIGMQRARDAKAHLHWGFLVLPADIEVVRLRFGGPPIPGLLQSAYDEARTELRELARLALAPGRPWDRELATSVAGVVLLDSGLVVHADVVLNWTDDEVQAARDLYEGAD